MPKKKSSQKSKSPSLSRQMMDRLDKASQLLDAHQPAEAREILLELDRKRPGVPMVLGLLSNTYLDLNDMQGYEWAVYRLLKIETKDPDIALGLAGAYISNIRPALAIREFEQFLSRWPDDERAAKARKTIEELRSGLFQQMEHLNLPENEMLELARPHEEVRFFMDHQQYYQGRQVAEKLLKKYPDFVPVINNLSMIKALEGDRDQAIEIARKSLEIDPDNVHALSNLTRWLFLSGREEEAAQMAQRLKESRAPAADLLMKKAEALAYLADYNGILKLYEQRKNLDEFAERTPYFLHLVAVAKNNLGQEGEARRLWQKALELDPGFVWARQNLDDLKKPIGERNGPWAFSLYEWIPEKTIDELYQRLSKSQQNYQAKTEKFLGQHPEILYLAPDLLERGDSPSREFILNLAKFSHNPDLLEALREFALGQRGSDSLRVQAAHFLVDDGFLPAGTIRIWSQGQWRDVLLLDFEVTPEADEPLKNPEAQGLMEEAYYALDERDAQYAQQLLEEAILIDPNSPPLLNNLAIAYEMLGQSEKSQAMIREIHARFPDYFFGIASVARLEIKEGNLKTARTLLESLLQRKKLHVTEFDTLCVAQIELLLAEKNREAARSWFDLWERPNPENPKLNLFRFLVGKR